MKIALIQTNIIWENSNLNLNHYDSLISFLDKDVDLIVLPEMFTTGFTMNPSSVAETMNGTSVNWMKEKAINLNCAIAGSLIVEENGSYFNRFVFVFPDGKLHYYDKRHLFTLAGEEKVYMPNRKPKVIIDYKGWKICPLICYDLRFPVYSRNVENYDILLYVANWPKPRIQAWDVLTRARAIENISYVIAVNRVGFDGNEMEYIGHSQVVDELGNYLIAPFEDESVKYVELSKESLLQTRNKLNFLKDKDNFTLNL